MSDKPSLKVMSKQCAECLFTNGRIVEDERAKALIHKCWKEDSHFICHRFSIAGENGVCKGFWDNYQTAGMALAKFLKAVEYVNPDDYPSIHGDKK